MVTREPALRREARQRLGRSEEAAAAEVEGEQEQEESSASATLAAIALARAEPSQVWLWHVLSGCRWGLLWPSRIRHRQAAGLLGPNGF